VDPFITPKHLWELTARSIPAMCRPNDLGWESAAFLDDGNIETMVIACAPGRRKVGLAKTRDGAHDFERTPRALLTRSSVRGTFGGSGVIEVGLQDPIAPGSNAPNVSGPFAAPCDHPPSVAAVTAVNSTTIGIPPPGNCPFRVAPRGAVGRSLQKPTVVSGRVAAARAFSQVATGARVKPKFCNSVAFLQDFTCFHRAGNLLLMRAYRVLRTPVLGRNAGERIFSLRYVRIVCRLKCALQARRKRRKKGGAKVGEKGLENLCGVSFFRKNTAVGTATCEFDP